MVNEEKNIIFGGELVTDFTKSFDSLGEYLYTKVNENPDKVATIDGVTGKMLTYREIKEKALIVADFFRQNSVKIGDVVGICSENCEEYFFTIYGALFMGITVAPINFSYKKDELNHAFQLSKPKIIFASSFSIEKIINGLDEYPFVEKIIQYGSEPAVEGILLFEHLLQDEKYAKQNKPYLSPPKNLNRIAIIAMSSGTTGMPKGVQLTEKNVLIATGQSIDDKFPMGMGKRIITCLPWFHIYGLMMLLDITSFDIVLVLLPRFEEHQFLSTIEKYKVTHGHMVPPLLVFLAKHPLVNKYDLRSLQELGCGGAPLKNEVEIAVMTRLPNIKAINQAYGLSETTLSTLNTCKVENKPGSIGIVTIGTYCKVIDPQSGKILGPNETGELCFKGPQIMLGYVGDDVATSTAIDKDGWFHTGDVGYYDDDKLFFIVDRLKELIKYKAFQVAPAELEALLMAHPQIVDAAVVGLPDEDAGEVPLAFVVKQPNSNVTEDEIKDFIASKVTSYKKLRGGVEFINEIPKNPSGKILRSELRKLIPKITKNLKGQ